MIGLTFAGLATGAAGLLGVAGVLALTALYLLRRRRVRHLVPFIDLWFSAGGSRRSERLARQLRRWGSLALQVAIFALVVLAAGDPRPAVDKAAGRTVVVLLDRSASMRAGDESESRLARARAIGREIVDGLAPDDRALIASFAGAITTATGIESDRARLRAAVDAVQPSDEPGDPDAALDFAATVLAGRPRPTLILIGDGGGTTVDVRPGDTVRSLRWQGIDVRFVPVGRRRDNLAIVAFSAGRLPADPTSVELALTVQSFRATPADVTVAITAGRQRIPIARRRLRLEPGARVAEGFSGVAVPDGRLEAMLEDARDDLPLDDRAFAVVPEPARLNVLVVGGTNLYLDGALLGLGAAVRVERVAPGALEASRPRWGDTDVVIFDGVTPDPPPRQGRFLFFDPRGPQSPWPERGKVSNPVVTDVIRGHPLARQLGLSDLNVASARRLVLGSDDVAVVSALGTPLVVARARSDLRQVGLAFDPRASDLPMRGAFPLLIANALTWLANRPAALALSWPTGRTIRIDVAGLTGPGVHSVAVVGPDGKTSRAPIVSGGVTLALDRVGFFEIVGANGHTLARVAANLASSAESDLAPRPMMRIGDRTLLAPDAHPRNPARRGEPWLAALLAALVLATGEWLSFHRRLTV